MMEPEIPLNVLALPLLTPRLNPVMNFLHPVEAKMIRPALQIAGDEDAATEVIEKRSPLSKTFRRGTEEFKLITSPLMVHYEKNGRMEEIDLTIEDIDGKKIVTKAPYAIEIFTDRVGYHLRHPNGTYFTIELVKIGDLPVDNTLLRTMVDGCQMFWEGLIEGVTMKVLLLPHRPQIFTYITSPSAPKILTWKITPHGKFEFKSMGRDNEKNFLEIKVAQENIEGTSFLYTETWTGRVSRKDKKTRIKNYFDDPSYPVTLDPSPVMVGISTDNDDGFVKVHLGAVGSWKNSQIYVGSKAGIGQQFDAGFRFQNVGVPQGATITSATLKFNVIPGSYIGSKGCEMYLGASILGNAPSWSNHNVPTKAGTLGRQWSFSRFNTKPGLNSIGITSGVASIVALGSWVSNNAMRFGLGYPHTFGGNFGGRSAALKIYDFNTSPSNAASLEIVYTTGGGGAGPANPRHGDMNFMGM